MKNENIEIIPAILPKDFDELERKLSLLKDVFLILGEKEKPIVQIDICDGVFVSTKTWPYLTGEFIEQLLAFGDDFDFEIDLFVRDPDVAVFGWQKIRVKRIVLHIESLTTDGYTNIFENAEVENTKFGFAVNLGTPIKDLDQYVRDADFFQFMGIDRIGHQGEKFNKGVLKKIKVFHRDNSSVLISVDGGVNLKNGKDLAKTGAKRLVVGSALFGENDAEEIAKVLKKFRRIHPIK